MKKINGVAPAQASDTQIAQFLVARGVNALMSIAASLPQNAPDGECGHYPTLKKIIAVYNYSYTGRLRWFHVQRLYGPLTKKKMIMRGQRLYGPLTKKKMIMRGRVVSTIILYTKKTLCVPCCLSLGEYRITDTYYTRITSSQAGDHICSLCGTEYNYDIPF